MMKHLLLLILFIHFPSFAHTRLKPSGGLAPRSNNAGLKSAPCGGVLRTANAKVYAPGETITVNWEETINHPGRFEFYFSAAGDANWTLLKTVVDTQDQGATVPHQYSTSLILPNIACTDCTLQLIQVMTEDPTSPSLYYSCADIKLQSTTPTGPQPIPQPNPCE